MRNCMLGLILISGLSVALAPAVNAPVKYVDGHCRSSLSSVGPAGEAYLAITNTATGLTIVYKFDTGDFVDCNHMTFDAGSVNQDRLIVYPPHNW
jgi:hypothetical protein